MKLFKLNLSLVFVSLSLSLSGQFTLTNLKNQIISMEEYDTQGWMIHLPSVSVALLSSGYTYGDLYTAETKTLSLQRAADQNSDLNILANARGSYGGIEMRKENWGLTVNHEWTADISVGVSDESVQFIVQGNVNDDTRNTTISPSVTYQKMHRFSLGGYYAGHNGIIGAKLHYLNGVESLYTKELSIEVKAQEDFFALEFRKNINILSSGVLNYNSIEDITYIGGNKVFTASPITSNSGFGLSIYGKANLGDNLKVYGIVDDIGIIKWSRQAATYTDQSNSSFDGIDIRDAYFNDQEYSLKDTLYSLLSIDKDVAPFTSTIGISLFTGLQYAVSDRISIEANYHGRAINSKLFSIVDLTGRYALTDGIVLALSNKFAAKKLVNIGLGANFLIVRRLCVVLNTTNPWALRKYYDMNYGDFSIGMSYWLGD